MKEFARILHGRERRYCASMVARGTSPDAVASDPAKQEGDPHLADKA